MHMSVEGLVIIVTVGVIAGWLLGQVVQGTGFGTGGDLIIGVAGAFMGGGLLPQLSTHLGSGAIPAIMNAAIGALMLLVTVGLVRGGAGWRGDEVEDWRKRR
jgi:uncharacterized membrane protein YeaQ/YmgE (transglycosylase-associated protein family)